MTMEEQPVEQAGEPADTYRPPFLRIQGTYPVDGDQVETVTVELNLRDDEAVGEYDPERPGDATAARSWVLDLVAATVHQMRVSGKPAVVVSGEALHYVLRGKVTHGEDCTGSCGLTDESAANSLGHIGSDRWTGGDRKDTN